ncbi:MAG: FHA domain-containing protein [Rhodospirillaceae bacterium]
MSDPVVDECIETFVGKGSASFTKSAPVLAADVIRVEDMHTGAFPATLWKGSVKLISYRGSLTWAPDNTRSKLVIGRANTSNLVIESDLISRIHGYITVIDKGCVYIDQSRNGTFVLTNGVLTKLNKSGMVLEGVGTLILGSDPTETQINRILKIEFEISAETG